MTEMAASATYAALGDLRVIDAMHPGLISCSLETPMRAVARMMSTYRVHAVLVTTHGEGELPGGGLWGIVTDTDLLRAAAEADFDEQQAQTVARTPVVMVASSDDLSHAAQLMVDRNASHLIVVERHSARPIGVLSTLDLARALAAFPERHPTDPGQRN
jgi:CBS domain-containing protein